MKGNIALYEKNLTIYYLYYAWFKFTCNHAPPSPSTPPPPQGFTIFFLSWRSITYPWARK